MAEESKTEEGLEKKVWQISLTEFMNAFLESVKGEENLLMAYYELNAPVSLETAAKKAGLAIEDARIGTQVLFCAGILKEEGTGSGKYYGLFDRPRDILKAAQAYRDSGTVIYRNGHLHALLEKQ